MREATQEGVAASERATQTMDQLRATTATPHQSVVETPIEDSDVDAVHGHEPRRHQDTRKALKLIAVASDQSAGVLVSWRFNCSPYLQMSGTAMEHLTTGLVWVGKGT